MGARRRFGWTWTELGDRNPLGAILTRDAQAGRWTLEDFLETGRAGVARFIADLERLSPETPRGRALDFGCGVGRITRALAEHFVEVVGVDVAESMIARARELNADCPRCRFEVNAVPHLQRFASGSFDVVCSLLVLQHIRPAIVRRYIPELVRLVAPGGVLMFQLPEVAGVDTQYAFEHAPAVGWKRRLPVSVVRLWRRAKYRLIRMRGPARMEMCGINRGEVERMIEKANGQLLAVVPDQSHGPEGSGFAYWVTRS